jgi:hypothetical protein
MPRVGLEPTIPVFERTKTVYTLDRAAIVIGPCTESTPPPNCKRERVYKTNMFAASAFLK